MSLNGDEANLKTLISIQNITAKVEMFFPPAKAIINKNFKVELSKGHCNGCIAIISANL